MNTSLTQAQKDLLNEVIDTALPPLVEQGDKASLPDTGSCRYRTPSGNKCLFGHLIDDKDYHPDFEGRNVVALMSELHYAPAPDAGELFVYSPLMERLRQALIDDNGGPGNPADRVTTFTSALTRLQAVHDGCIMNDGSWPPDFWRKYLEREIAKFRERYAL